MATITLKGTTEVGAITVDDNPRQFKKGANQGKDYYVGRYDGKGFNCSEDFFRAYKAGTLEEVSLTEGEYDFTDPATNQVVKRASFSLGGWRTKDQVIAALKGDKSIVVAKAELAAAERSSGKIAERAAYVEAGLSPEEMRELMALA